MTRDDVIARAAEDAGIPKTQAAAVLNSVLDSISDALKGGDKVTFVGFGAFSVSQRAARMGRNPQSGASIQIPASRVPRFKAGKRLKSAVQ
jgi:DNA-binding protein HU-beta